MDIRVIEDFAHLASSRSFTETANARNISQSALSRRISSLEEWAGARLFDRSIQPVALTEAGEQILPMAIRIVEFANEIRAVGTAEISQKQHTIGMVVLSALVTPVFMPLMADLKDRGEDWDVKLADTESNYANIVKFFVDGKADFLITFWGSNVNEMALLRNNASYKLKDEKIVLVSRPGPDGDPLWSLENRSRVPFFSYSAGSFLGQAVRPLVEGLGDKLNPVWENSMVVMLKSMVMTGEGVALLPLGSVKAELDSGQLVRVGGAETEVDIEIRILRAISLPPYARRFWKSLGEMLEGRAEGR